MAYYFSALALGLLGGLSSTATWRICGLMALILVVMFIGDHPRLLRGYQHQIMVLDSAITDQIALVARLEQVLGARVHAVSIQRVDLVNDTTMVDVRYSHRTKLSTSATAVAASGSGSGIIARLGARR